MKSVLNENRDKLLQVLKVAQSHETRMQNKATEIEAREVLIHSEILNVSEKAVNLMKQKEHQLISELRNFTKKQIRDLKGQVKAEEINVQMYQQHYEFINKALASGNEMDMYGMYQMCQSGAMNLTLQREPHQTGTLTAEASSLYFVEEFDQDKMGSNLRLGSIAILKEEFDQKCTPILTDTLNIRTKGDKKSPDPIDVTVLDVDGTVTVVATDYSNRRLKSFFTRDKTSSHSSLKLSGRPQSLTSLNFNQVAVSFEENDSFAIVKVIPDLVHMSTITTQKMYSCLSAMNDSTLIADCHNPPSLDILDVSGQVQRSITPAGNVIQWPNCIHTTKTGNILVSDDGSKSVYCLTPDGEVVFSYFPQGERALGSPQGITSSPNGDILLSDWSGNKVVQLTQMGNFVRDILTSQDDMDSPYGICLNRHKLYVTQAKQPLIVFEVNRMK